MKIFQLKPNNNQNSKINSGSPIVPNYCLYLGIIAILGALGGYAYRYRQITASTQKEDIQLNLEQIEPANSINSNLITREQLSPEDLSVAADLGNIDVLLKEIEQSNNQQSFTSVKNISKNNTVKPNKFSSQINPKSTLLNSGNKKQTNVPSLNKIINNNSIGTIIDTSSISNQTLLLSRPQNKVTVDNNVGNPTSVPDNQNLKSVDRLDNQKQNLNKQDSVKINSEQFNTTDTYSRNNFNTVNNQNNWNSSSNFNRTERFNNISNQSLQPTTVSNSSSSNRFNHNKILTGHLSDYQIKLQDYNRLVPRNYLSQPRISDQLNQVQNNKQSETEESRVSLNNLASYQIQPQEINQFNPLSRSLKIPNTSNLSQGNSFSTFSTNKNQSNSNFFRNSGLQTSGNLQPSGFLNIN